MYFEPGGVAFVSSPETIPLFRGCLLRGAWRSDGGVAMLCSVLVVLVAFASFAAGVTAMWLFLNRAAKQLSERDDWMR